MIAEEMQKDTPKKLTICVSSRSLLYIEKEFKVYKEKGLDNYIEAMKKREEEPFLDRGAAFPFIQALFTINKMYLNSKKPPPFDIVLLSNNCAQAGLAITKALNHHELKVEKIFLTSKDSVISYLGMFDTVLYLSAKKQEVIEAHKRRYASLQVVPGISKGTEGKVNAIFGAQFIRFDTQGEEQCEENVLGPCFLNTVFEQLNDAINGLKPEETPIEVHCSWSDARCELCTVSVKKEKEPVSSSHSLKMGKKGRKEKKRLLDSSKCITICISARSLFDIEPENKIYKKKGLGSFTEAMQKHENGDGLKPGSVLPLVKAVLEVNDKLLQRQPTEEVLFDVVIMSQIGAQQGIPVFESIKRHKLPIERVCLTAGKDITEYLKTFKTDLFISADLDFAKLAHEKGIAAGRVCLRSVQSLNNNQLRVAFDGDWVLFKREESQNKTGTDNGSCEKRENTSKRLLHGPLSEFAKKLGKMQKKIPRDERPIRTYLVTKRKACEEGAEVILTFRNWGLDIDELFFTAHGTKRSILQNIQPHIFFDDKRENLRGEFTGVLIDRSPFKGP